MKVLQEITDDPDRLVPSGDIALRQIEKLPLPYTGNKKKLVYHMHDAILKHDVQCDTVLDAFTGSATVAYLLKYMNKRVIANDFLTCAYVNAVAFIENDTIKLTDEEKEFLIKNENPNKNTFVEDNYLGTQFRPKGKDCRFNKFTLKECQHLDNFRANIDELCSKEAQSLGIAANQSVFMRLPFGNMDASKDIMTHRKKQKEKHGKEGTRYRDRRIGIYYDNDLNLDFNKWFNKYVEDFTGGMKYTSPPSGTNEKIKRAVFLVNLQQHVLRDCMVQGRMYCGQALAETDIRLVHPKNQLKGTWDRDGSTEMDFLTQTGKPGQGMKWWSFAESDLPGSCLATNMDVTELLKSGICSVECAYFDPPYGGQSSDYPTMYRFLEEYIYGKPLEELPHIQKYGQKFVGKKNYEKHFIEMLEAAKYIPTWMFSYNDTSWKDIEYITNLIRQFKKDVVVEVLTDEYRYLYRKKQGRESKSSEYLIIAR